MKFALVVNLSKERAIKYAKRISLFLLDKNAEIAMIEECSCLLYTSDAADEL